MTAQTSVYTITHQETGDMYVGVSNKPRVRWGAHKRAAKKGNGFRLHRALAKHGFEAFDWQIVAELPTPEEAKIAERVLIALENPVYNLTAGGDGTWGCKKSAEEREGIRQRMLGNTHSKGKKKPPRSAEHAKKLGEGRRGTSQSDEAKQRIGAASAARPRSEATKQKMRDWHAKRRAANLTAQEAKGLFV